MRVVGARARHLPLRPEIDILFLHCLIQKVLRLCFWNRTASLHPFHAVIVDAVVIWSNFLVGRFGTCGLLLFSFPIQNLDMRGVELVVPVLNQVVLTRSRHFRTVSDCLVQKRSFFALWDSAIEHSGIARQVLGCWNSLFPN